jgi:hypothetical protein
MCGALSIFKYQMNHNSCDIPHTNTIDMMVYAYAVTTHKWWLNVAFCIEMNFLHATA